MTPWAFTELVGNLKFTGQFTDVYSEGPADAEAEEASQNGATPDFPEQDADSNLDCPACQGKHRKHVSNMLHKEVPNKS